MPLLKALRAVKNPYLSREYFFLWRAYFRFISSVRPEGDIKHTGRVCMSTDSMGHVQECELDFYSVCVVSYRLHVWDGINLFNASDPDKYCTYL